MIGSARRIEAAGPFAPGDALAHGYEVIAHLRRGNDLDVYDVWSAERGARCIIKAVRPDRLHVEKVVASLLREGAMLQLLSHPHIVRAYETVENPAFVVLETLDGHTLGALLDEEGPCDTMSLGHLGLQLGSAVQYLHSHGTLHLDLKPSNVIADAGRAKLIDLSLARPPGQVSAGFGTWDYLSPEQAGGGSVGPPADVWGLGAVLFEAATGEPPYDDDPDADRTISPASTGTYSDREPDRYPQLERPPRRADSFADVEPAVATLLERCLSLEPDARPEIPSLMASLEHLAAVPRTERRWDPGPSR